MLNTFSPTIDSIFKNNDLPLIGPDSKLSQSLKTISETVKELCEFWNHSRKCRAEYENFQNRIIQVSVYCGKQFVEAVRTIEYSKSDFRKIHEGIGDFYRYGAEVILMLPKGEEDNDQDQHIKFDDYSTYAWHAYDLAQMDLERYNTKMTKLFDDVGLYCLIANMRHLLVTLDQHKFSQINPEFLNCINWNCKRMQTSLHPIPEEKDTEEFRIYKFLNTTLQYIQEIISEYSASIFTPGPYNFKMVRPFNKMRNSWSEIKDGDLDLETQHAAIVIIAFTAKLWVMTLKTPPVDLSVMLKTNAVKDIAARDFISEEREDLWTREIVHVMKFTEFTHNKNKIALIDVIRMLNSRPTGLLE